MLRRLHACQYSAFFAGSDYSCPFCKGIAFGWVSLAGTDFNSLLKHAEAPVFGIHEGGERETVNINAYIAEHRALNIHLRNL